MPFEVECHTVPHLKALTRGIEHASGHGCGRFLHDFTTPILHHTEANEREHLQAIVCVL